MTFRLSRATRFRSTYDVPGYMLRLVSSLWHRELNRALVKIDLTEMQLVLILGLGWIQEAHPEGITQKDLAAACGISTALASQVIQTLTRKEFIEARNHERDARARALILTKQGKAKAREALRLVETVDREFWKDVPAGGQHLFDALREVIAVKLPGQEGKEGEAGAMPRPKRKPRSTRSSAEK